MTSVNVPNEVFSAIVDYLYDRPYREVHYIIEQLQNTAKNVYEVEEEQVDEEKDDFAKWRTPDAQEPKRDISDNE